MFKYHEFDQNLSEEEEIGNKEDGQISIEEEISNEEDEKISIEEEISNEEDEQISLEEEIKYMSYYKIQKYYNIYIDDIYNLLTNGNQEIVDFIQQFYIDEVLVIFFSRANTFMERFGLLKCINAIIQNHLNDPIPYISNSLFVEFQNLCPNQDFDDDQIQYLLLFLDSFNLLIHQSNMNYYDEEFFRKLLQFLEIDNQIDSKIVLLFNQLYLKLPKYSQCLILETKAIFSHMSYHILYECSTLFNTLSNKIPQILVEEGAFYVNSFTEMFNKDNTKIRALLLNSLLNLPYSISQFYINESITGFVSDSIYQLSTMALFAESSSVENQHEYISIQLLNYTLINDSAKFLNVFFNFEKAKMIEFLILIIENALYSFKEICGFTFLFIIDGLIKAENNDIFVRFVQNKQIPIQFATYIYAALNLDNAELKNKILYSYSFFLEKVSNISVEKPFLLAMEYQPIIQTIIDDVDMDRQLVDNFLHRFFPDFFDNNS